MKIRNVPYDKLDDGEQRVVRKHYKECMHDKNMECRNLHSDLISFWEAHRKEDTNNGKYDGWKQ